MAFAIILFRMSQIFCTRHDNVDLTKQLILQASIIFLQNTWHKPELVKPSVQMGPNLYPCGKFIPCTCINFMAKTNKLINLQFKSHSVSAAFTVHFPPCAKKTLFQFKSRYVQHDAYIHLFHSKIVANHFQSNRLVRFKKHSAVTCLTLEALRFKGLN